MITSLANAKVKHARSLSFKKNRAAFREFCAEGTRVIEESERAGIIPALVFFDPESVSKDERAGNLLKRLQAHTGKVHAVKSNVLCALAQTENPQGIVAIYPYPDLPLPSEFEFVLILDSIRDPGNLGTILRTAWAAGVDWVLLAPGTADPFNSKVVRAAMGAHFFLPLQSDSWAGIARALRPIERVYLADARGGLVYSSANWARPCALIVGGEAGGSSAEGQHLATARLSIPMPGNAESLNAAVAAGILMFEAMRSK